MLTRRWWAWTAPFWLVAVLAGGLWGSFSIPAAYERTCQTTAETNQQQCSNQHFALVWTREVAELLNYLSPAIVALATLAVAGFTWTLWRSTNKLGELSESQIALAREEFISTHRPKLVVRQFQLDPISANSFIRIWYSIVNVGDTEATLTFTTSQTALWNPHQSFWEAPGIDPVMKPMLPNPITIRSGQRVSATADATTELTDDQVRAILVRNLIVCAVGEITYRDALGTDRRVGFRRNYDVGTDMFLASSDQDQEYQD